MVVKFRYWFYDQLLSLLIGNGLEKAGPTPDMSRNTCQGHTCILKRVSPLNTTERIGGHT